MNEASRERDLAVARAIEVLADQDLPDLKRMVATVRRALTATPPDPTTALPALVRLTRIAQHIDAPPRPRRKLPSRSERKEEVPLLEVARFTQRTPYGERRDVQYFLDLEDAVLYRELAASKPGDAPATLSEGPFGRRILGNLVALEEGLAPRRIWMLQYATIGFATEADLDRLQASCQDDVASLYALYRGTIEAGLDATEQVVMFAPHRVLTPPSGIVFCDDSNALLPLARSRNPALCATADLLARQGRISAVVGQLVLERRLLVILPFTLLVDLPTGRSLRRLS